MKNYLPWYPRNGLKAMHGVRRREKKEKVSVNNGHLRLQLHHGWHMQAAWSWREASIGHLTVDTFRLSPKIKKSTNIKYQVGNYVYMSYEQDTNFKS